VSFDKYFSCSMRWREKGVSKGEGGYAGCSTEGHFIEQEVYREEVSMGL